MASDELGNIENAMSEVKAELARTRMAQRAQRFASILVASSEFHFLPCKRCLTTGILLM